MVDRTGQATERSYAPFGPEHLDRLAALAVADHAHFTRSAGRPDYRDRLLAVVLAQGAACHYVEGRTGVKDLDVWMFYAAIAGQRFPADRRETHADFGPSEFGRQLYDAAAARSARELARWRRWESYTGRRVDFLMRALPLAPSANFDEIAAGVQAWLEDGRRRDDGSTPAHLARKAMVLIDPPGHRGKIIWPHGRISSGRGCG